MNIFQESTGDYSIRRVLAFGSFILMAICGPLAIALRAVWQIVAIAFGVPAFLIFSMVFFTTWEAIKSVIQSIKGKNE